jgi:predicted enzyme related to lactoylglutathione lyase
MMVALDNLVQFSIPVSDVPASMRFYTEIVGLKHLRTVAHGMMAFFDAAGVCVILVRARSVRARESAIGASRR